jgi:hypothetical protein
LSETRHADGSFDLPNRLAIFAPQNPDDQSTRLSLNYLAIPLLESLPEAAPNWNIQPVLAEQATKANLQELLGGAQTPALLFTATHGMAWPMGHAQQMESQGALVCQDWPGPKKHSGPVKPDFWFSAADIPAEGKLLGTIMVSFGDFVAGTPFEDNFLFYFKQSNQQLAEKAFLAKLPQTLLSHPRGGMLALVAHVERAWGYSFLDTERLPTKEQRTSDIEPYRKLLSRLMQGSTIGMAMEDLNRRYSYFSTALADELVGINFYKRSRDETKLQQMMLQTIDARNYIIIGDPAVRLPVRADLPYQPLPAGWQRPEIEAVSAPVLPEVQPSEPVVVAEPELLVEVPTSPTAEAVPEAESVQVTGGLKGVDVDSLASALIKGQKLKLGDYK